MTSKMGFYKENILLRWDPWLDESPSGMNIHKEKS